eukprot:1428738-Amphidinium_carterae.1
MKERDSQKQVIDVDAMGDAYEERVKEAEDEFVRVRAKKGKRSRSKRRKTQCFQYTLKWNFRA